MSLFIYFSHTSPIQIWGLTSAERVERVLQGSVPEGKIDDLGSLQEDDSVLILRGDYLFDDRLVKHLAATPNVMVRLEPKRLHESAIAAHVPAHLALQALAVIEGRASADTVADVRTELPATISASFEQNLHKFEPPFVLPITAEKKHHLERRLFDWSYKGITDLVTKWAWPTPARWVVGHCVRLHISPNHVTLLGLFLAILAGFFFYYGQFGWGLLAGWLMTFLDTVDGKLARVTVTSSKFGHYFDHLIDLVHPPIWYILWGLGLPAALEENLGLPLSTLFSLIMIGYVAGRLVEGSFQKFLGTGFVIFSWRPVDSYFRLITARRNPCLILLTLSYLLGRPELGLLAVVLWTVATSIFLLGRLLLAGYLRCTKGPLRSWLADADQPRYAGTLAVRWFTKHMTK